MTKCTLQPAPRVRLGGLQHGAGQTRRGALSARPPSHARNAGRPGCARPWQRPCSRSSCRRGSCRRCAGLRASSGWVEGELSARRRAQQRAQKRGRARPAGRQQAQDRSPQPAQQPGPPNPQSIGGSAAAAGIRGCSAQSAAGRGRGAHPTRRSPPRSGPPRTAASTCAACPPGAGQRAGSRGQGGACARRARAWCRGAGDG